MILIINCGSSKTKYIEEIVDEFCDFETIPFFELTEEKALTAKGLIFSGAPLLITEIDMDPYIEHINWLKEYQNPILGICFGHQLIGLLYGAFGSRMKENRDWLEIEVVTESLLFEKLPSVFDVMEDHCESISIPEGFELLASSDECINEAMQHKDKMIYGLQFHPEVSGNFGRVIIENFVNCVDE